MTQRPLRTIGAVVLGTALILAAPFVFLALAIIGLQPFPEGETLARVVVVLMSLLLGLAVFVGAGFVTFKFARNGWLVPAPYALALLLLLAGMALT